MTKREAWKATFPFSGVDARLPLLLTGPNGQPCRIVGKIDTGSTVTALPYHFAAELGFGLQDLRLGLCTDAAGRGIPHLTAQSPVRATIEGDPSPMFWELRADFIDGRTEALWGCDFVGAVAVTFDAPGDVVTLACTLVYPDEAEADAPTLVAVGEEAAA